jgi:hypothetical protein
MARVVSLLILLVGAVSFASTPTPLTAQQIVAPQERLKIPQNLDRLSCRARQYHECRNGRIHRCSQSWNTSAKQCVTLCGTHSYMPRCRTGSS